MIVHKIQSFCHGDLNTKANTDINIIKSKIMNKIDPIESDYKLAKIKISKIFPSYIIENRRKLKKWII